MRYYLFKIGPVYITKVIILTFLVIIFSFFLQNIIKDLDMLNVKEVKILGNNMVDTKSIVYLSKITRLKNIIKIDVEHSKEMIETHPFIKAVGVSMKDRVFYINVIEREPFIFVSNEKDLLIMDIEGVVLDDQSMVTDYDLPVLTGIKDKFSYKKGGVPENEKVQKGLQWFRVIPIEFWSQISEINVSNDQKVVIYTLEGIKIFVDNIESFSKKFEILYNKLLELKEKKYAIDYFDLRTTRNDIIYKEYKNKGGH